MAENASLDMRKEEGHGNLGQKFTTWTSMMSVLHGRFRPLKHRNLYRRPQAAPLSHNPSFTATKRLPGGNWSTLFPLHAVAENTSTRPFSNSNYTLIIIIIMRQLISIWLLNNMYKDVFLLTKIWGAIGCGSANVCKSHENVFEEE